MSAADKLSKRLTDDSDYAAGSFAKGNVDAAAYSDNDESVGGSDQESDGDERAPRSLRDAPSKSDRKAMEAGKKGKRKGKAGRQPSSEGEREGDKKKEEEPDEIQKQILVRAEKYQRGMKPGDKSKKATNVRSKKAQYKIEHQKKRREEAILDAARTEVLLTEEAGFLEAEEGERTFKYSQKELAENLDVSSADKIFDLKLNDFGPYTLDYTRNGKFMLVGGRKGHLATMDWRNGKLGCEIHVRETIRDVAWLHNESLFAVAQKRYAYIYDHTGAEVHCMRKHVEPTALGFLPYHFLLASTGMTGRLVYQDVTEGKIIGEHKPGNGQCHVLKVNPYNAVVHLGHGNGTVSLWSPKQSLPLAKMLCHKGPVQAMAIDRSGTYMATSGLDGRLKVWDIRNFKPLQEYVTMRPAQSIDISQRGLLAAGWGPNVTVWKDALAQKVEKPYMKRMLPSTTISSLQFVPYDDVLGYGHNQGISSIVIPGAGEPNFDAYVANPYETLKQRQESEVKSLLDKLAPETIQLDPNFIGRLDPRSSAARDHEMFLERQKEYMDSKAKGKYLDNEVKNKTRGRNSTAKRYQRKRQSNIMDLKKLQELDRLEKEIQEKEAKRRKIPEEEKGALGKFYDDKRKVH
ncbi:BING4CT-domain-containing protein [Martensiomyces pterosporus]|nr:BING4CT-domain-containing protein [Martensiomyces pterosporus]